MKSLIQNQEIVKVVYKFCKVTVILEGPIAILGLFPETMLLANFP